MKVAIVHEWLQVPAGAERVLEQLIACWPEADVFATIDALPAGERGFLHGRPVHTSFIQRLPFGRTRFRAYLGLMPLAVEQYDLSGYDLVISSNHAVAKGVLTGPDTLHVSYVHSPIRYAWDLQHQYLRQVGLVRGLRSALVRWMLSWIRQWDVRTANGVDVFVANSSYVARRIWKCYRRAAQVVPPPVDVERFEPGGVRGEAYLLASRMVPYKRMDVVVAAFAAMPQRRLIVAGDGPERARVEAAAQSATGRATNISFVGAVGDAELVRLMQEARAFVFAAEEDFGIMLVEALACGTPVIAFGRGGARDIVQEGVSGLFFEAQTAPSIADAVARFEAGSFQSEDCRARAVGFNRAAFRARMMEIVARAQAGDRALLDG